MSNGERISCKLFFTITNHCIFGLLEGYSKKIKIKKGKGTSVVPLPFMVIGGRGEVFPLRRWRLLARPLRHCSLHAQQRQQFFDTLFDGEFRRVERQGRVFWRFKWRGDTREVLDFATARAGIKTFHVPLFAHLKWCGHEDFFEVVLPNDVFSHLADFLRWADEGGDGDDARVDKEFAHFGDAPNVFAAVFGRETQVGVDARADVVAIEDATEQAAILQGAFQSNGHGAFSRAAQSGEPEHHTALPEQLFFVFTLEHAVVDGVDVISLFSHFMGSCFYVGRADGVGERSKSFTIMKSVLPKSACSLVRTLLD